MVFKIQDLDGQWASVLADFGINVINKPGQSCPVCGGKDRFHYTNKHNNGTHICRQCTPEGGTGFGLLAKVKHWDNKETYKQLRERYNSKEAKKIMYEKKEEPTADNFIRMELVSGSTLVCAPVWDGVTLANKDKPYQFKYQWLWRDHEGRVYAYVARLEFPDKETGEMKKIVWQIHYGHFESNPANIGYHQVSINPKPLFGYSARGLSAEYKAVILCEGEKTCMALKSLIGKFSLSQDYLILCCQGGAAQINSTDFTPLIDYVQANDLPVYIWADNDDTGFKHADALNKIFDHALIFTSESLEAIGCKYSPEHGQDAADIQSLTQEQLQNLINTASCLMIDDSVEPTPAAESKVQTLLKHVNPLGVYEGSYVFYPKGLKCIQVVSANNLLQEATMLSIVDEELLHEHFPKIDKETGDATGAYDYRKAGRFFMSECKKRGTYDPDSIRGVGVWKDSGKIVVNTGTKLVVAGKEINYDDFKTNCTYSQPGLEKIKLGAICSKDEIKLISRIVYGFNWAKPYYAHLMLGCLIQAPIASALRWRAHVWITGPQGTGKSTLQSFLIKPLLGNLGKSFGGATTAAGIRQSLKCDPLAVCFDEAEVTAESDNKRLKDIISLARISSSDENTVVKGSASGDAVEYHCQSPFIMSSIKPFLKEEPDIARFALLELAQPSNCKEARETFKGLQKSCMEINEGFSERWIAFCVDKFDTVAENMIPVRSAMIDLGLSPRTIDQYGQLIACAMVVNPSINLTDFTEMLDETKEHTADIQPLQELTKLLNHEIRIPTKYGDRLMPIREVITIILKPVSPDGIEQDDLVIRLAKYGLRITDRYLYIANNSSEIETILGYPGWNKLFKIIKGAIVGQAPTTFGGNDYKSRYVKLSVDIFAQFDDSKLLYVEQPVTLQSLLREKPNTDAGF